MMSCPGDVITIKAKRRRGALSWALVLGTVIVLGIGCGLRDPRLDRSSEFTGGFRWAAGDASRLIRNAHYFKLMGQPELALKELEEVHRQEPGNMKVADALAHYCDELGLSERAQQIYLEALALDPDNPALQNNLAFSYYLAGNWRQAETGFRKTLARHPNNQAARNNLGLLLCRQGRQEEARRMWQEAEGEAAAAQKMGEALAVLGMAAETRYAQQARPNPAAPAIEPHSPAGRQPEPNAVTATAGPPPSQAPAPALKGKVEPGTRPLAPVTTVAAIKPAKTLPPPQKPDSPSPAMAAPKPLEEDRVNDAPPSTHTDPGRIIAENRPTRPLPPRSAKAAATPPPPSSPRVSATPESPAKADPQPVLARKPDLKGPATQTSGEKPGITPRAPITARELLETNIAVLNGNGIPHLAHETRSRLSMEGFNVVTIANYRDFGMDRTVIYYRPDAKHVATILNSKFFPRAEIEPAPQLANSIDVQVILGHDLLPQQHAEALQSDEPKRL